MTADTPSAPPSPVDRPPLDAAVAAARGPVARWGLAEAGAVVLGAFVLEVVVGVVAVLTRVPASLATLVGESMLGGLVYWVGRPIARQSGGWAQALGLGPPVRRDLGLIASWVGVQLVARYGAAVLLAVLIPALRRHPVSNTGVLHHQGTAGIVLFAVAIVVVAPIVEETQFRGIVLRGLMGRFSFWPAALVSSVLFGLMHAHEGGTLLAAGVLTLSMTIFGVLQCLLVRRTGRLGPAIGVHATLNALAMLLVLLRPG